LFDRGTKDGYIWQPKDYFSYYFTFSAFEFKIKAPEHYQIVAEKAIKMLMIWP